MLNFILFYLLELYRLSWKRKKSADNGNDTSLVMSSLLSPQQQSTKASSSSTAATSKIKTTKNSNFRRQMPVGSGGLISQHSTKSTSQGGVGGGGTGAGKGRFSVNQISHYITIVILGFYFILATIPYAITLSLQNNLTLKLNYHLESREAYLADPLWISYGQFREWASVFKLFFVSNHCINFFFYILFNPLFRSTFYQIFVLNVIRLFNKNSSSSSASFAGTAGSMIRHNHDHSEQQNPKIRSSNNTR